MATLTAIRRARPGHVELEVDGTPWRTVPDDVVVNCGLAAGLELERIHLRAVGRELRRIRALVTAGRVLARRDISSQRLGERLAKARVPRSTAEGTVVRLAELGVVDDRRLAARRASALAGRGWGDAAILAHLEAEAITGEDARETVAGLVPEEERARGLADAEPNARRAWALLARRGFSEEAIERALGGRLAGDDAA